MKSCYFTYKGQEYPRKEELISVLKAEIDTKQLIAPVKTGATVVKKEEKPPVKKEVKPPVKKEDTTPGNYSITYHKSTKIKLFNPATKRDAMTATEFKITSKDGNKEFFAVKRGMFYELFTISGTPIADTVFASEEQIQEYVNSKEFTLFAERFATKKEVEEVNNLVEKIELSQDGSVTKLESNYVTKQGVALRRVSNVVKPYSTVVMPETTNNVLTQEEVEAFEWSNSATAIAFGNVIDEIARDVMNGKVKSYKKYVSIKGTPLFSTEAEFKRTVEGFKKVKEGIIARGETIITNNGNEVILSDTLNQLAGTVDLMTITKDGKIKIYDFKTHKGNPYERYINGTPIYDYNYKGEMSQAEQHAKQLSYYAALASKMFNAPIDSINIISTVFNIYDKDALNVDIGEVLPPSKLELEPINLNKVIPTVILNKAEFFQNHTVTDEDIADLIEEMKTTGEPLVVADEKGEIQGKFVFVKGKLQFHFENGSKLPYEGNQSSLDSYLEDMIKHKAFKQAEYDLQAEANNNAVVNKPIKVNLPTNEVEKEQLFLKNPAPRTDEEAVLKAKDKPYVFDFVKGDRLDETKIKDILYNIAQSDSPIKQYIGKMLLANADLLKDIPIVLDYNLESKGIIYYNKSVINVAINPDRIRNSNDFEKVMIEEFLHAVTIRALKTNSVHAKRISAMRHIALKQLNTYKDLKAKDTLTAEEQQILNGLEESGIYKDIEVLEYRLSNDAEFLVGSLISPIFQKYLNNVEADEFLDGVKESVWKKILNFITSLFKLDTVNKNLTKLAIYDALTLTEKGFSYYQQNPELLNIAGDEIKSVAEVETIFNLRNEIGELNRIENAEEVASYINSNVYNIIAVENENNTISIMYRPADRYKSEDVNDIDDAESDIFEEDEYLRDAAEDKGTGKDKAAFRDQVKSYIINLYNRRNALRKSLAFEPDYANFSKEELVAHENKRAFITREIQDINEKIKNIKGNRKKKNTLNSIDTLYDLSMRAKSELMNINKMLSMNLNEADIIYILNTTRFWSDARTFLFNEKNEQDAGIRNIYTEIEGQASAIDARVLPLVKDWIKKNLVQKYTSSDKSVDEILKDVQDINALQKYVDDLGIVNNTILQAAAVATRVKDTDRAKKTADGLHSLKEAFANAMPSLKAMATDPKNIYDIFRRKDEYGRNTSSLVSRYSADYSKRKYEKFKFLNDIENEVTWEDAFGAWQFLQNNAERINLTALFPDTITEDTIANKNKEATRIVSIIGQKAYDSWYKKQEKRIKSYEVEKYKVEIRLMDKYDLASKEDIAKNQQADAMLNGWIRKNSPFNLSNLVNTATENPFGTTKGHRSFRYYVEIPKKQTNGVSNYDLAFEQIEKDETLMNLYEKMQEVMDYAQAMIPSYSSEKLGHMGVPEFQKQTIELFLKNTKDGLSGINNFLRAAAEGDTLEEVTKEYDIITGQPKGNIRMGINSSRQKIKEEVQMAKLEHMATTGDMLNVEETKQLESKIRAKYADKMDFQLDRVFAMYFKLAAAYETKTALEDTMKLTQVIMNNAKEYDRNKAGNLVLDKDSRITRYKQKEAKDSFVNQKEVLNYTVKALLYGETRREWSTKNKTYTKEEKKELERLESIAKGLKKLKDEGRIPANQYSNNIKEINAAKAKLGAYLDYEKVLDLPVKITQWKGMGWNIIGGISNMVFGYMSNKIEAAGGQYYTSDELAKATRLVIGNSGLRNLTFNTYNGITGEALKIRSLMDNYNIMSNSGREYTSLVGKDFTESLKWAGGFNVNERTEYINQAPLLVIFLQKAKFNHNGQEHSLYDGFTKDGQWNTQEYGEYPTDLVNQAILKTKTMIQRNHGNYNPLAPMLLKRESWGRFLIQFRTWMVDGYRNRVGYVNETDDPLMGGAIKGRYISVAQALKEEPGKATLGMVLQVLQNFIPAKSLLGLNKNVLDKYFEGSQSVSEVDVINMKKTAMELSMWIGAFVVGLTLKSLTGEWDDDDPEKEAANFVINQLTRAQTDIAMYVNPLEAMKIVQDPVPALKTLKHTQALLSETARLFTDDSLEYEQGVHKGRSKLGVAFQNFLPGFTQFPRFRSYVGQEY